MRHVKNVTWTLKEIKHRDVLGNIYEEFRKMVRQRILCGNITAEVRNF